MKGLVLLFFFPFTYSFGFHIHTLIGQLLESFISPLTLQNLHKCHYPTDFSKFSTWADKIKRVPKYSWTRTLHYYDIDNNPPEFCSLLKYPDDTQPKYNLIQFIHGVLEKNTSCISTFDFKLFIHLLQDFFQPLHLTGKERGGNSEFFYFQDKKISLHSFWDTKLFDTHYKDHSGVLLHFSNLVSHKLKNEPVGCSIVDLQYIISLANSLSQINCDIIWKYNDIDYLEKSLKTLDKLIVDSVFHSLCILDSLKNEDEVGNKLVIQS